MTSLRYCQSIFLIFAFLFLSQCVSAQDSKTIVSGVITIRHGAVIPNAKVIGEDKEGKRFSSVTNSDGEFKLELPGGVYKIEIISYPFTEFVIAEYLVGSSGNMRLNVVLQCNGCEIIDDLLPPEPDMIFESEKLAVSNQILSRVKPNTRKAVKKSKIRAKKPKVFMQFIASAHFLAN